MRKPIFASFVVAAVFLPATALAGGGVESTLLLDNGGTANAPGESYLAGSIDTSQKCKPNRKVKLITREAGKSIVLDTGRSSDPRGAWAVHFRDSDVVNNINVKLLPAKKGNTTCKGDTVKDIL
jgi:hypothetical protein